MDAAVVRSKGGRGQARPGARPTGGRRAAGLIRVLVVAAVLLLVVGVLCPATASAYTTQELAFLDLLNQYRQQHGLGTLLLSDMLSEACWRHNSDMGKYDFFAHNTVASDFFETGATPWDRMAASGYSYNTSKGENIAAGYSTAQAAFNAWRNSPGHDANMLGANFKVIGISMLQVPNSRYGIYWTTDFGGYIDPTAHAAGTTSTTSPTTSTSRTTTTSPPTTNPTTTVPPPADTQAPAVSIVSPPDDSTISGSQVVITVTANDNTGVSRVELSINGSSPASDTTSPYRFAWDTARSPNGQYTLTARAYDAAGNSSSHSIRVIVANPTTTTQPTTTTTRPPTTTTTTQPPTTTTTARPPTTTTTSGARPTFVDVPRNHAYYPAVEGMKRANVIQGYPVGQDWEFRLDDPANRAQFAKMICGTLDIEVSEDLVCPFTDLGEDDRTNLYPHEYVAAAARAGITQGVGGSNFAPWREISRAQVVTMIVRAARSLRPGALEAPSAGYAAAVARTGVAAHDDSLRVAEYNGLLAGLTGFGPMWDPWANASRGEVAEMLWALMNLR